jgi:hypothetical protein
MTDASLQPVGSKDCETMMNVRHLALRDEDVVSKMDLSHATNAPTNAWRVCTQRAGPEPPSGEEYAAFTNARLRGSCHCQQAHFFALSWIVTPREGYADASDGEQVCRGRGREADR